MNTGGAAGDSSCRFRSHALFRGARPRVGATRKMRFISAGIAGAYIVEPEEIDDERGFFARTYCSGEFMARGLTRCAEQCSISYNLRRGTLRGMHYQIEPHAEAKLIRCARGALYDVLLDMRFGSATFGRWRAFELTAENRRMVYAPELVAHGFQTLADDTEVHYQMSAAYEPSCARAARWDDPAFQIRWPIEKPILSERDARHALWV
jgi:dTDP-4-dehydrorhamnose 3,5-epimerase